MVNKSYVVNNPKATTCSTRIASENENNELVKCERGEKMQNNDQKKIFDRYILQISNEMVKMKPKSMFYDEKHSTTTTNFWNNRSIIRWNRECIDNTKSQLGLQTFVKIVILIIILIFFGVLLLSWLSTSPQNQLPPMRDGHQQQQPSTNHPYFEYDESSDATTKSPTSSTPKSQSSNTMTEAEPIDVINLHRSSEVAPSSTSRISSTTANSISNFDEPTTEKSTFNADDDALLLTKKYVERINFYTTSNKNLYSVKVSPTLPSIRKHQPTSSELPIQNYANENSCQSTSLPLCQGVLSYDLTDPSLTWNLTNIEYQHFQHLLNSECSKRAADFICRLLEPECRPTQMKHLKPCRRICKGIFESCSHVIASSEVLTEFFDCNTYTDSHDHNVCEDITRFSKKCFDDEFQCSDYSCIPSKWRCDNIRDCSNGDDEDDCKFCNYDQFRCVADGACISEKWYCDGFNDCIDGSDEMSCDIESDEEDDDKLLFSYYDEHDYDEADGDDFDLEEESATEADHNDSDGDKIVSTGDGVKPIFVNPNVTITAVATATSTTVRLPKRFRTTLMRNFFKQQQPITTTTTTTTTSTTTEKSVRKNSTAKYHDESENVKASTSHLSPSCPEFELRCVDGLCITLDQICDKVQDCTDNADELHCEY